MNLPKTASDQTKSGNLERWAQQGVLLLNAVLTVEAGKPASHANRGWELFTDAIIMALLQRAQPTVFMLWGSYAQKKVAHLPATSLPASLYELCRTGDSARPARRSLGEDGDERVRLRRTSDSSSGLLGEALREDGDEREKLNSKSESQEKYKNFKRHLILKAGHPSPLSVTRFMGCRHFSQANEFLKAQGLTAINW